MSSGCRVRIWDIADSARKLGARADEMLASAAYESTSMHTSFMSLMCCQFEQVRFVKHALLLSCGAIITHCCQVGTSIHSDPQIIPKFSNPWYTRVIQKWSSSHPLSSHVIQALSIHSYPPVIQKLSTIDPSVIHQLSKIYPTVICCYQKSSSKSTVIQQLSTVILQ